MTTGQFFTAAKLNYRSLPKSFVDAYKDFKKAKKAEASEKKPAAETGAGRKSIVGKIAKVNYTSFVKRYMPFVSLWICRVCSFTIAYAYDEYAGFLVLTWVLLSFIIKMEYFNKWSKMIYLPLFTLAFFYEYLINIQFLFSSAPGIFEDVPRYKEYNGGEKILTPINPVEIGGFVLNIIFMIVLARFQTDITKDRDGITTELFEKMASDRRNFLWQLSFFLLQRIHLILLCSIFAIGMDAINLYYIGLLYFFMKYVSSVLAYRKSGSKLVAFTGFFIWVPYMWSLIKIDFYTDQSVKKEDRDFFFKLMQMITLESKDEMGNNEGAATFNSYMEVPIPFGQWVILLLFVLMKNINNMFKTEKYKVAKMAKKGITYEVDKTVKDADYYEEKIEKILTRKFPFLSKIFIRIQVGISEAMNLTILIVQSLTLAFQEPNIMYWGFLVLSLVLQAIVISLTYGYKTKKNLT